LVDEGDQGAAHDLRMIFAELSWQPASLEWGIDLDFVGDPLLESLGLDIPGHRPG